MYISYPSATVILLLTAFVFSIPKKYWMCSVSSFRCYCCAKWTRILSKKALNHQQHTDSESYKIYETLNIFGRWFINWLFKNTLAHRSSFWNINTLSIIFWKNFQCVCMKFPIRFFFFGNNELMRNKPVENLFIHLNQILQFSKRKTDIPNFGSIQSEGKKLFRVFEYWAFMHITFTKFKIGME